jgi:hypothetical protein
VSCVEAGAVESREFGPDALDFWIGDWTVSWPDGAGTNSIRRILDNAVIEEVFECHSGNEALYGRSHSVLDQADGRWKQTWVDSSGAYLDFVAVAVDAGISFQRSAVVDGRDVLQRMVWLDVRADGFRWEWQRSADDGATWTVSWGLDYQRVAQPDQPLSGAPDRRPPETGA